MATSDYTGTVERTLPDIIGDYPSVMAWGAVGDGVTDDTAAFNAAFSATATIGGTDVLFIPANRIFIVTALTLSRNGFRLLGSQGQDSINNLGRIKLKNATNAVVLTVSGNNCRVEGVNIDGNASNQTVAHPAVEITGAGVTLAESLVRNSKGDGVKVTSADSARVSDNTIRDNALFGINLSSATNATLSENELASNTSGSLSTASSTYKANGNVGIIDRVDYQTILNAILAEFDNDTGTGTTVNRLVTLTSSGKVALAALSATGVIGVCTAGAGTSGKATIATSGASIPVDFDGATTAGDYVVASSSTAGKVSDAGATFPAGGQVLGRVLSTNGSSGTYAMLWAPESRGGATSQDLLSGYHIPGVKGNSKGEVVSLANGSTQTLLNISGAGYVDFMWLGVPYGGTLTITIDGVTTYNDQVQRFFAGEYLDSQAAFAARWFSFNQPSGMQTFLPIPFGSSIVISITNNSGSTKTIYWEVTYQTSVPVTSWNYTKKLYAVSGVASGIAAYATTTLCNLTGLNRGRLAGIYLNYDGFPGNATPRTAPLEGNVKIYLDGAGSPTVESSGTEDYFAMSDYFNGFSQGANSGDIGLTIKTTDTYAAYRIHDRDPIAFANALKVTWDNGNSSEATFTGTSRLAWCVWYYTE